MSLRIAHITPRFAADDCGIGQSCYHHVRELARRGNDVHVFVPARAMPAEVPDEGYSVQPLRSTLPSVSADLRDFDAIHLHYPFRGGDTAALAARLSAAPVVVSYHHDSPATGPLHTTSRLVWRSTLRSAASVLCASFDYAQVSRAVTILHGRENVIAELPPGVDAERFTPATPACDLRAQHSFAPTDRVALMVAELDREHAYKGVGIFLRAFAYLPDHARGVVIGDGALRTHFRQLAGRFGVSRRVLFVGDVDAATLPDYYCLADVTVLPAVGKHVAYDRSLIESLACGTPVITSDLPGLRAVVDHNNDGWLIAPNDTTALAVKIQRLLDDEPLRQAMGERGRAKIEARHDWRRVGEHLEAMYQQVRVAGTAVQLEHEVVSGD